VVLSVSIVTYQTPNAVLDTLWRTFFEACDQLPVAGFSCQPKLTIVDNSIPALSCLEACRKRSPTVEVGLKVGHGNIGFAAGHNLALEHLESHYHMVLNPDVELQPDTLLEAFSFMESHPECGLLAPAVFQPNGERQFLCKRYPAIFDLYLRGFAPSWLSNAFKARLDWYEMRDVLADSVFWDPPIISGCFMFFRTEILKRLGGFDPRFFLYFEDFDLSIRASRISHVAYVPRVRIVHHGGFAARKGLNHVRFFATSAFKFYNKNGWKFF
jgi:GT2 family glycosyltransferase